MGGLCNVRCVMDGEVRFRKMDDRCLQVGDAVGCEVDVWLILCSMKEDTNVIWVWIGRLSWSLMKMRLCQRFKAPSYISPSLKEPPNFHIEDSLFRFRRYAIANLFLLLFTTNGLSITLTG